MTNTNTPDITNTNGADPDSLLADVQKSIIGLALIASTVIHLVVIAGSSFGLYKEWGEYGIRSDELGFHTPSKINEIKNRIQREKEDAERKAAAEQRAAEAAAAATNQVEQGTTAQPGQEGAAATQGEGEVVIPELEPLPPKTDFTFGDDLTLD